MRRFLATAVLFCLSMTAEAGIFRTGGPATTDNDASCDISVLPAATLLLPYFEVDIASTAGDGETTIFTVTNTSNLPQIARVTLWTDYDYPVMNFNIFLTGYDVQSINLYDVIARGVIAPDSSGTGYDVSAIGELSGDVTNQILHDNPHALEHSCVELPVFLPRVFINRMQSAFTTGKVPSAGVLPACNTAGGVHSNAVGYATIDVVSLCGTNDPTHPEYYSRDLLFDNVLGGDYLQINGNEDFAQGSPMVHIRAVPEGGSLEQRIAHDGYTVNLPRTFYSRFLPAARPLFDARQPLPATFSARWISGGATGFETYFKIWREGRAPGSTPCSAYPARAAMNMIELVRFDEEENPETLAPDVIVCTPIVNDPILPVTSLVNVTNSSVFPENAQDAVAGWMYMNLDYCNRDTFAGQNWVVSSMRAEDRFSVDVDALGLGNGCTAPVKQSEASNGFGEPIGPAANVRP